MWSLISCFSVRTLSSRTILFVRTGEGFRFRILSSILVVWVEKSLYLRLVKQSILLLNSCIFSVFLANQMVCLMLFRFAIVWESPLVRSFCIRSGIVRSDRLLILLSELLTSCKGGMAAEFSFLRSLFIILSALWRCVAFSERA